MAKNKMAIRIAKRGIDVFAAARERRRAEPQPAAPPVDPAKLKADVDRLAAYWEREAQRKAAANRSASQSGQAGARRSTAGVGTLSVSDRPFVSDPTQRTKGTIPCTRDLMAWHNLTGKAANALSLELTAGRVPAALRDWYPDLAR